MTHNVIFDIGEPELAHTRIDCPDHLGLIELVEHHLGRSCDDPAEFEHVAALHGLISPAHLATTARRCGRCTAAAAAPWWPAAA